MQADRCAPGYRSAHPGYGLDYTDSEFDAVADRFVAAAKAMDRDGWWWCDPEVTSRSIKRSLVREMIAQRFPALRNYLRT